MIEPLFAIEKIWFSTEYKFIKYTFQMTDTKALFRKISTIDVPDVSGLLGDLNKVSTKDINDLAESFEAFIQGRFNDASEVRSHALQKSICRSTSFALLQTLTTLIDQYETNDMDSSVLSRLYFLRSESESRFGQLKSKFWYNLWKDYSILYI